VVAPIKSCGFGPLTWAEARVRRRARACRPR
jgi:hypothetical protein